MSHETALLLDSLRWTLHGAEPPRHEGSQPRLTVRDTPNLLESAQSHRIVPHLYTYLKGTNQLSDPSVQALFSSALLIQKRKSLKLVSELLKLSRAFDHARINYLPIKGPLLSQTLFGDPTTRTSADLDIFVAREDVPRTCVLLQELHFRSLCHNNDAPFPSSLLNALGDLSFINKEGTLHLELHFKLLPVLFVHKMDFNSVWAMRSTCDMGGKSFHTLSHETYLFFLCAHGSKHAWERLHWLFDFAVYYSKYAGRHNVVELAKHYGVAREFKVALNLCRDAFDLEIPAKVSFPTRSIFYTTTRSIVWLTQNATSKGQSYPVYSRLCYWVLLYGTKVFSLLDYLMKLRYKTWVLQKRPYRYYYVWQLLDVPLFVLRQLRRVPIL